MSGTTPAPPEPRRDLTTTLAALVVNCVVGAGVLGLPGRVYALAGISTYGVLAAAAALALGAALCLAELGSRFAETGGPLVYVVRAFGPGVGFVTDWLLWTATVLAAASLLNLTISVILPLWGSRLNAPGVLALLVLLLTVEALSGVQQRRRGTPTVAVLITAGAVFVLAQASDVVATITASSASRLLIFIACAAALVKLRRDPDAPPAAFRLPAGDAIAGGTAAACTAVLVIDAVGGLAQLAALTAIGLTIRWIAMRTKNT